MSPNTSLDAGRKSNVILLRDRYYDQFNALICDQFASIVLDVNTKLFNKNHFGRCCENWRLSLLNDPNEQRLKTLLIFKLSLKLASIKHHFERALDENIWEKFRLKCDETKRALASRLPPENRGEILSIIEEVDFEIISVSENDGGMFEVNDVRGVQVQPPQYEQASVPKEKIKNKKKVKQQKSDQLNSVKIPPTDEKIGDNSQKRNSEEIPLWPDKNEEHGTPNEAILNTSSGGNNIETTLMENDYEPKIANHIIMKTMNDSESTTNSKGMRNEEQRHEESLTRAMSSRNEKCKAFKLIALKNKSAKQFHSFKNSVLTKV